jgi:hypothetical protein
MSLSFSGVNYQVLKYNNHLRLIIAAIKPTDLVRQAYDNAGKWVKSAEENADEFWVDIKKAAEIVV